jgi:hypothetical protein
MVTMRKNDAYLDDDDMVVPDGGSVKVRLELMDALQRQVASDARNHQPHHAELTDKVRQLRAATRGAYVAQLTNAWRMPGRDALPEPDDPNNDPTEPDEPDDDDTDDRERTRSAYLNELQNAWRRPERMVTGFGPTVVGAGPAVVGAGPGGRDAQAIRDRDAAWNEYRARLSNAWRGGR